MSDVIDVRKIMEYLPHRYPMLLVDRIIDVVPGESATGIKNVTFNEPQFQGHFPGAPIFPGVMIVEAMAQTAGALVVHSGGQEFAGKLVYFMAIDEAKFRKPVMPGDVLHIHVAKQQARRNVWKFRGEGKVNGELCAEAVVTAMIVDR
jgi:3-hydroxyacyl-[acyl-carrier-protein] dehydratase